MSTAKKQPITRQSKEAREQARDRALQSILKRDGTITIDAVLNEAKRLDSPLHQFFEWNDRQAAAEHRRQQAYELVRASRFIVYLRETSDAVAERVPPTAVRKYLPALSSGGFKERREVLESVNDRTLFVEQRLAILDSWCRSVIDVAELDGVRSAVSDAVGAYRRSVK